jgi:hypothetical protein
MRRALSLPVIGVVVMVVVAAAVAAAAAAAAAAADSSVQFALGIVNENVEP